MAKQESSAFDLLHTKVQRWIWNEGWEELKDIQEEAIRRILESTADVIISAPTASGKTEAAFLPITSKLVENSALSVRTLYVSPLKALINDQWERLDRLCEVLEIPVHKWHGDVAASAKQRLLKSPSGILLITPESLEALFVRRGSDVKRVFASLDEVVIDELHAFIGNVRGMQLQSLLHRLESSLHRQVRRIGLSATLSDMSIAADFLRPSHPFSQSETPVSLVQSADAGPGVNLQIRGYRSRAEDDEASDTGSTATEIGDHLFSTLRGSSNLVFANRRSEVEECADLLRRLCEAHKVPQEFWPHHGSLARQHREGVEEMLKDRTRPVTVVCTSTLELGIDIGAVKSIAQIGCPPSVASMRQRLGRSGRRGEPAVLRIYITETELDSRSTVQDSLRMGLVQAIAMVELLKERWYEPPDTRTVDASTMLHQILALVAERGGITADVLWAVLCETGPFRSFSKSFLVDLLRSAREHELIEQSSDRVILLGAKGEKIANHFTFYTVFWTPEEFRLVTNGRPLGSLPISFPVAEGSYLIFAGLRWRVLTVDQEKRVIELTPSAAGRAPIFGGGGIRVHDQVRARMRTVFGSSDIPAYLDSKAANLLKEARENFYRLQLDRECVISDGKHSILFPWAGDRIMNTLTFQFLSKDIEASKEAATITVANHKPDEVRIIAHRLAEPGPTDAVNLARTVRNKIQEKYDRYVSEDILSASYASRELDSKGAWEVLHRIGES